MDTVHSRTICFSCRAMLPQPAREVAGQILDLARWPEFRGYGPIPGIKAAGFDRRTPEIVGTRIRVTNLDGSTHVEEIVEWDPQRRVRLEMKEFSPPLSRLATLFEETWEFDEQPGKHGRETLVVRSFRLHAKNRGTRVLLRLIAVLLKRAIARHLRQMAAATQPDSRR